MGQMTMSHLRRSALVLWMATGAGLGLTGCQKNGTAAAATEKKAEGDKAVETAVPVEVVDLATGEIESLLRFSTNVLAENEVKVFAQAARLVRELLVEEGHAVRKGQILLRLQDEEQRSALAKAQSQYERAEREYQRLERLHAREMISDQVFSDAKFDYEQKQLALVDARREVGYTDVTAPITGVVTARLVKVGDQINIGQHLFDLVDFDSLKAPVFVPEKELVRLRPGQQVRLHAQATGSASYHGHIERIAPVVDPRSGTVKVTVAIDDRGDLRPGMYVDVELVTDKHLDALLVPKRALIYDKDQVFVYRLKPERRVERVPVLPALTSKTHIEPEGGLAVGDQIVVAGQAGLKDDALVRLPGDPEPTPSETVADGAA